MQQYFKFYRLIVLKKIISILIFILFTAQLHAQQCSLKIDGHVHSDQSHEVLSNATVFLAESNQLIKTDDNGDFSIENLCEGSYTLIVHYINYDSVVKKITIKKNLHVDIDLVVSNNTLKEVVVSGQGKNINTGMRRDLSEIKLFQTRGSSLAEALSKLNGVTLLQTGSTISKPVVHGLHGNRIVTVNNGVRQEGQQWGNEHAPEIDPFIADKLTFIKGVDELRYGSDAIGGVVLVEPKALRNTAGVNTEFNSVYFSNNRQYVLSGIYEQQLKRLPGLTWRLQGTLKKGANTATPGYTLNNTALEEKNFSTTLVWRKEHFNTELFYSFFDTQLGIFSGSHVGNLSDLLVAIDATKPDAVYTGQQTYSIARPSQDVKHQLLKWKTGFDIRNHKFTILLSVQHNLRKEFDVVRSISNKSPQLNLSVLTFSQELNWEHPRYKNLTGIAGVTATQQDNSYTGRYLIPNYLLHTWGVFYIEKWNHQNWDVQAGLRTDNKSINTTRLQSGGSVIDKYAFNFNTYAASLNTGYKLFPDWKVNANFSLSSRSPHVNELLTNGLHHGTATYEVGNINLIPEVSKNISINSSYSNRKKNILIEFSLYHNRIDNFIYQQPRPDQPVLTIRGAFPKIEYLSTNAALSGLDFSAQWQPVAQLTYRNKYSILRARNLNTNDWLIWMPSDRIENEIAWNFKDAKRFSNNLLSITSQHVLFQKRTPDNSTGKQDYKSPPPRYNLLHADFTTTFIISKFPFTLNLSCRNILNTSYREYLNSFRYFTDEMGRNFVIRLKININH